MINYFRAFIDKITFDALVITSLLWLCIWIAYEIFMKIENTNTYYIKRNINYIKKFYLIILFIISYVIIKMYIKKVFLDQYLDILKPL